jgi:hypothetical protein
MKKLLTLLALISLTSVGSAQQDPQCQPYISYQSDSGGVATFTGYAVNLQDSMQQVNVTTWNWSISGCGQNNTYTGQTVTTSLNPNCLYSVCLTITTATGCNSMVCDTINAGGGCNLYITGLVTPYATGQVGNIDITVTGGAEPYSYSWNSGEVTEDITYSQYGYYTVTVTDSIGCSMSETFYGYGNTPSGSCQANFVYVYSNNLVTCTDLSFNTDSMPMTIISWSWTLNYNGSSYTSSLQNPIFKSIMPEDTEAFA